VAKPLSQFQRVSADRVRESIARKLHIAKGMTIRSSTDETVALSFLTINKQYVQ
jgi:hypothetical protein